MDRNNRPVGRKKNVIGGSAHVGRRPNTPAGGGFGGSGGIGGGSGGGGGLRSGGGGGGGSLIKIIAIIAALVIGGGGGFGALTGLFGGGDSSSYTDNSYTNNSGYVTQAPTQFVSAGHGKLDTTVSPQARDKRVVLKGSGKDVTTIMVYMCGTDLESRGGYASKDISEMTDATLGENINLLIYTGGCKKWSDSRISSSKNQIFAVESGKLKLQWESNSLKSMTDPSTLSSFIRWGVENRPADRYQLIFWDHGGGSISGYGYDEVYQSSGSMTLDGIATALRDGGCTFDFIGFDACLMATLETALVVEPYADYLIASEETEPGCGWYYTNWLTSLAKSPSKPALEIGKQIADDFVSMCGTVASGQQATLSIIDLAELKGTVPQPFADFAKATANSIRANDYKTIAAARGNTKEFSVRSHIDQIDLVHLTENVGTAEAKALGKALRGAVKYNATSSNIQNANGVSIYFPYGSTSNVNKMAKTYDKIGLDASYTDCIRAFASVEVAGQTVSGGHSAQVGSLFGSLLGGGSSNASGMFDIGSLLGDLLDGRGKTLENIGLNDDMAQFIDAELVENSADYLGQNRFDTSQLNWTTKDGRKVMVFDEDNWSLTADIELNVFVDDGEGYIDLGLDNTFDFNDDGDLLGEYDRTWLSVNGQIVAYYMVSNDSDATTYSITGHIPALLNGERVELVVVFDDEHEYGAILGAEIQYEDETDTQARGLVEIEDGDRIDFICNYYGYDRKFQDCYLMGETLVVNGPLTLGNIHMDNDDFIVSYRITDVYNNHYWTPSF